MKETDILTLQAFLVILSQLDSLNESLQEQIHEPGKKMTSNRPVQNINIGIKKWYK